MYITVTGTVASQTMGDGWADVEETARAYAAFLAVRVTHALQDDYPEAQVTVRCLVDAWGSASGVWQVATDDAIIADHLVRGWLAEECNLAWEAFCSDPNFAYLYNEQEP